MPGGNVRYPTRSLTQPPFHHDGQHNNIRTHFTYKTQFVGVTADRDSRSSYSYYTSQDTHTRSALRVTGELVAVS